MSLNNRENFNRSIPFDVLVIDHDQAMLQQIGDYLAEYEVDYKLTNTNRETVALVQQNLINLILIDIDTPELDAFGFTQTLRNDLKINVPVVATTHAQIDEVKDACFNVGMNACLQKPICKIEMFGLLTQFAQTYNKQHGAITL